MGRDAAEVVDLMAQASANAALRLQMDEAGRQSCRRQSTGVVVAAVAVQRLAAQPGAAVPQRKTKP